MKRSLLIIIVLLQSIVLFSQEHETPPFLESDSTWGIEMFKFPIRFAREINYQGTEDARFPKGWGTIDSSTFWSYVFGWNITTEKEITKAEFERDLKIYFDGLNDVKGRQKTDPTFQNTSIKLIQQKNTANFKGQLVIFDHFTTNKYITLNVMIESHYCKEKNSAIIIFRFSPKDFKHDVWKRLYEVKAPVNTCNT